MAYKFEFRTATGGLCCASNRWVDLCQSCKRLAISSGRITEEQAKQEARSYENKISAAMATFQTILSGDNATGGLKAGGLQVACQNGVLTTPARAAIVARLSALPTYAGWRLNEMSDSALAELDRMNPAQAPAPAASPLRAAIIQRLSSRLPVQDLNLLNDEVLAALDSMFTASAPVPAPVLSPAPVVSAAPAPVLRKLPDPLGVNAQLEAAKRPSAPTLSVAAAISEAESVLQNPLSSDAARLVACSVLQRARGQVRELPDTMGVRAAEARRAEAAQNEEAKKLEERRIEKENSGWDKVNAMVEANQQQANANRAAYEALQQARASARNNPNSKLRELPDPLGLKAFGLTPDGKKI